MLISRTPLRVSFAGGGTDFEQFYKSKSGVVVSAAIDKFVYVVVNERHDEKIYLNYSKREVVDRVEDIQHELIRESMKEVGILGGIEICCMADIPSSGSGLGSSSSFTVGILNALYQYAGRPMAAETLAAMACTIEIERCGKPIGKQDQYIAAYGGLNAFEFKPDNSVSVSPLGLSASQLERLSAKFMLFYTHITRSSEEVLKQQVKNISSPETQAILTQMRQQAIEAKKILARNKPKEIGALLKQGWEHKKKLASGITLPEIDALYSRALEAGALGGKLCGAGGGGFLLLCVPASKQAAVRQALSRYREMPFRLEPFGSRIIFSQRGFSWK